MKIHTLKNGATVISLSAHAFRFSDGTTAEPQDKDIVDRLTIRDTDRVKTPVRVIKGMQVNYLQMVLSVDQIALLHELCQQADIVILPFVLLAVLREQGIRERFPNAVAFNATPETQRAKPDEKVVDIDNWSW